MSRRAKMILFAVGTLVLLIGAAYVFLWYAFSGNDVPSNIIGFSPTKFAAKAESKFFYSTGNELKYSDQIDPQAPTLLRGRIEDFLVSPDQTKIATVANGELVVVGTQSVLRYVTSVDSIYREPKPKGQFFRNENFQWAKDSKSLYLIRDEFYDSKGSQLFSEKGELWRYDVESGNLQPVLKPFRAYTYFFGLGGIYFSEPTEQGELQLKYFDGSRVIAIGDPSAIDISPRILRRRSDETPFFSFSIFDYQKALRSTMAVETVASDEGPERLIIKGRKYLEITEGHGFKGPYYCSDMLRSVFLPGEQYFVFNVPSCGNYRGQLLIDVNSGRYDTLPPDTVVYVTLNTGTYRKYRVGGAGIEAE